MTTVYKQWEVSEEVFDQKFTHDYIKSQLTTREKLDLMVRSDDGETIKELHFYKSNDGEIYVSTPIVYKNALNLLNRKELTEGNKGITE